MSVASSPSQPAAASLLAQALEVPYLPRDPKFYRPAIGLVACGGITHHHLDAYRRAGYRVTALCDTVRPRAEERQREYFPQARVYDDYRELLRSDDIEVVDLAAHPPQRAPMIREAIEAGKHVLSQKPFVTDVDYGCRMAELADRKGVRLAVNQNGCWAPHFSFIRGAIAQGLLGDVTAAHLSVHWDHTWVQGTAFDDVKHLILYDFAVHWFDIVSCFLNRRAKRVYASYTATAGQTARPPLLAQALIEFDGAQASLAFDADTHFGPQDRTYVAGTQACVTSVGPDSKQQCVTFHCAEGQVSPTLSGTWFPDGFHGTMGELLCAIEERREPSHSARNNLRTLELCFAAVASAEQHQPIVPGTIRKLPGE